MDPLTISTTVITIATALKDVLQLSLLLKQSVDKASASYVFLLR